MSAESNSAPVGVPALDIAVSTIANGRRLTITGELDMATAESVVEALEEGLQAGDVELELTGVSFMDSSGINTLLRARDACRDGHRLVVVDASTQVARLIEMVGAAELLGFSTNGIQP